MKETAVAIFGTVFAVTAVGIALRPGAPTASVITSLTGGIAKMQSATFGPR